MTPLLHREMTPISVLTVERELATQFTASDPILEFLEVYAKPTMLGNDSTDVSIVRLIFPNLPLSLLITQDSVANVRVGSSP